MLNINKKAQILKDLIQLVEANQTGNATDFAKKIKISRSYLYEIIDELRSIGIELSYSKEKNSFLYKNNLRLKINTPIEVLTDKDYSTIYGGRLSFSISQLLYS